MKKILIFDCWLPGFTYIRDLAAHSESVSVTFVHSSSLQTGGPAREYVDFKKKFVAPNWVHDFSEYQYDFNKLFDAVKPDAVLVLSLHHIEARTALLFAKGRGVPTYFIPHGIFLLREEPQAADAPKKLAGKLRRIVEKLPRVVYYTSFFWRFHMAFRRSGIVKANVRSTFGCFRNLIGEYFYWQWKPALRTQEYYAGIIQNLIIYDRSLEDYYRRSYGRIVEDASFIESGTLDMSRLIRHLHGKQAAPAQEKRNAYYISSPYPEWFSEPQTSLYKDVVRRLRDLVHEAGYDCLIYRPHPGETKEFTHFVCNDLDVQVDSTGELDELVSAGLVCSTSSSLLYIAIVLGKPILILDSKRIRVDQPYYEPLISYPSILFNADIDHDDEALRALAALPRTPARPDTSALKDPITDLINLLEADVKS